MEESVASDLKENQENQEYQVEIENQNKEKSVEDDNLFISLINNIQIKHRQGVLSLNILFGISIYNFLFFESVEGKELYVLFPLIMVGIAYGVKYWESDTQLRILVGVISLILGLLWDLSVSISFIPNPDGGYSVDSIPTLIADILGLISLAIWIKFRKIYKQQLPTILS